MADAIDVADLLITEVKELVQEEAENAAKAAKDVAFLAQHPEVAKRLIVSQIIHNQQLQNCEKRQLIVEAGGVHQDGGKVTQKDVDDCIAYVNQGYAVSNNVINMEINSIQESGR